jgi:uncharacterized protein (DUF2147 family)
MSAPAAESAVGAWLRDNGGSRIAIAPCGAALCGHITWLRDRNSPGKPGQRILYDMKPSGPATWSGNAFNPEDGKTYSGKMTVSGNVLTTSGCVLGGLICQSVTWTRVR